LSATPGSAPLAPQNFTGDVWDLHVVLQWSAPLDDGGFPVTGYRVCRGASEGSLYYLDSTIGTLYNDKSATAGNSYYYAASAANSRGEGPRTAPVLVAVGEVPAPPTLFATAMDASVELTWVPGDNGGFPIQNYRIFRGEQAASLSFLQNDSTASLKDTAVTNGVTYYYAVSAQNAIGEGSRSAVVSATPYGEGRLPGSPLNLTATAGNGNIQVSWNPPSDTGGSAITAYSLYKGDSAASLVLVNSGTSLEHTDSSVIIGRKYYYAVSATNAKGEGTLSAPVSALVAGEGRLPSAPRNLTASAGNGYVLLGWEGPTDNGGLEITAYRLFRGLSASSLAQIAEQVPLNYNDTVVLGGGTYYYAVSAVNSKGEGPRSDPVAAVPGSHGALPGIPEGLMASAHSDNVVLTWSAPADTGGLPIKGYSVYRGIGGSLSFIASTNRLDYYDSDVTAGNTYNYRVAAVNDRGEGPLTVAVNGAPGFPPSAPRDLKVVRQGGSNVLSWQPPLQHGGFGVTSYKVYRGTHAENAVLLFNTTGLSYSDTVKNDIQYYYMVSALNSKGEGPGAWSVAPAASVAQPVTNDRSSNMWMPLIIILLIIVMVIAVAAFVRAGKRHQPEPDIRDSEGYRPMEPSDYETVQAQSTTQSKRHRHAPSEAPPSVPAVSAARPATSEPAPKEKWDTVQEKGPAQGETEPKPDEPLQDEKADKNRNGRKKEKVEKTDSVPESGETRKDGAEQEWNAQKTGENKASGEDGKKGPSEAKKATIDTKDEPRMTLDEVLARLNKGR